MLAKMGIILPELILAEIFESRLKLIWFSLLEQADGGADGVVS